MGGWGGGMSMSRSRAHNVTSDTYNPDLEYTQQGYADQMYGRGAPIGSYGMTGGQYPTAGIDRPGYGSNMYDNPFDFHSRPGVGDESSALANANYQKFGGGPSGTPPPGGGTGIYPGGGNRSYGQPGNSSYQVGGGGGGGMGYGGYSAMQPGGGGGGYQFGSGGAGGNLSATGAAAYGGFGGVSGGYSQLGRQYARMGSQGVTPQERANLMSASNTAIQSNLGAYRDMIGNRAAQSGNTAGYSGALARLGASSGQQLEAADRANQTSIMAENQRRKEAGLAGQAGALQGGLGAAQGQAGLYSTGTGYMSNLLAGRGRLASLTNRQRTDGTTTGGSGGISYGGGGGG